MRIRIYMGDLPEEEPGVPPDLGLAEPEPWFNGRLTEYSAWALI